MPIYAHGYDDGLMRLLQRVIDECVKLVRIAPFNILSIATNNACSTGLQGGAHV